MVSKLKLLAEMKRNPKQALNIYLLAIGQAMKDNMQKAAIELRTNAQNPGKVVEVADALVKFGAKAEKDITDNLLQVVSVVVEEQVRRRK